MALRIEIGLKDNVRDARGSAVVNAARQALNLRLQKVLTRTVYKIDAKLSAAEAESVRRQFHDPVIETAAIGRLAAPTGCDWVIEIGFKPGVTDNVGRTRPYEVFMVIKRDIPEILIKIVTVSATFDGGTRNLSAFMVVERGIRRNDMPGGYAWAELYRNFDSNWNILKQQKKILPFLLLLKK